MVIFNKKAEAHHIGIGFFIGIAIGFGVAYLMANGTIPDFLSLFVCG